MDTQHDTTDRLKDMFCLMQDEPLPASFRMKVMERVAMESVRIRKRNERIGLLAVVLASVAILALAVASFVYIGLPEIKIPKLDLSAFRFYLFIGALSLILLFLDYKLRCLFRKN